MAGVVLAVLVGFAAFVLSFSVAPLLVVGIAYLGLLAAERAGRSGARPVRAASAESRYGNGPKRGVWSERRRDEPPAGGAE